MFDYHTRKIILRVVVIFGAMGLMVAAYRFFRVMQMTKFDPLTASEVGSKFGRGTTDAHCLAEALDRADACWLWDVRCETEAGVFGASCLTAARRTGAVCSQFRSSGNIGVDMLMSDGGAEKGCERRGAGDDTGCYAVMSMMSRACMGTNWVDSLNR